MEQTISETNGSVINLPTFTFLYPHMTSYRSLKTILVQLLIQQLTQTGVTNVLKKLMIQLIAKWLSNKRTTLVDLLLISFVREFILF